jgi:HTH-type transcriptional regulator, sugar sensing transcriptional regulator
MRTLNLMPFGFTPTESLVYQVLLTTGPGTGYGIARAAGLARANAYSALEGLVTKGAARVEGTRPKRYRPEAPTALVAQITSRHGQALEELRSHLAAISVPESPTLVEIESARGSLQLIAHDIGRAAVSVRLLAPADAYPPLTPALRKAANAGVTLSLRAFEPVELPFANVTAAHPGHHWPGQPLVAVIDDKSAVMASRSGAEVRGHWSTAPAFVAAAALAFERFGTAP